MSATASRRGANDRAPGAPGAPHPSRGTALGAREPARRHPQALARALDAAVARAQTETDQARIWRGEAEQRENAEALLERVRAAVAALHAQLADEDTGERRVLSQIVHALEVSDG
jgi:hypothetical protein